MDIEILYKKNYIYLYFFFSVITKYCPTSKSNINMVVTDINNVESSTDSDSSNKVY